MADERDVQLARLTEQQHGVFDRPALDRIGFTKRERATRVQRGRWVTVYEGVYRLEGAPVTWRTRVLAAVLAGGPGAGSSHRSATALWALPGGDERVQELLCHRWRRAKHAGLVVHETTALSTKDLTVVESIPVTSVERTLLDLGAVRSPLVVEQAVEAALRRDLTTIDALEATLRRLGRRGRNGAGVLRTILGLRTVDRALTESDMELRLLQVLRRNGLPEPATQCPIRDAGRFVARVDAAFVEWKIALVATGDEVLPSDGDRLPRVCAAIRASRPR